MPSVRRRALRSGERYERWVHAHAVTICGHLGLDLTRLRIRREVRLEGRLRYRVDILAESADDVVVFECKDSRPSSEELLYANHRVIDLARAMPERNVYGVVMATRPPNAAGLSFFDPVAPVLAPPPNLAAPMTLFVSPPRLLGRNLLLWKLTDSTVEATVLQVGRGTRTLAEIEEGLTADTTRARLTAALEAMSRRDASPSLLLAAATTAASAFHHLGSGVDTRYAAAVAADHAEVVGSRSRAQEAQILRTFADYRIALDSMQLRRTPGARAVRRLSGILPDLTGVHHVSALQMIGPWQGLYDDTAAGVGLLKRSLNMAEDLREVEVGAYLQFIGRIRLAEIDAEGHDAWLDAAVRLLPTLAPMHREWADLLAVRMASGQDVSIATRLPTR
jgi:hypothetical protein